MGDHLIDGEFQSDKYPSTPRGKVPLSVKDPNAQDLLWRYAQRHRRIDAEFSNDLETALQYAGYKAPPRVRLTNQAARDRLIAVVMFIAITVSVALPAISWHACLTFLGLYFGLGIAYLVDRRWPR